jgi:tetratricopeptide (TPR) repeat protein
MTTIDYAIRVAIQLKDESKLEEAQSIINSILEIYPKQEHALHLAGIIAHQKGKTTLSIELIQKAIENNPNIALFHSNLGEIHRQLQMIDLSIQCGQRAIVLEPQSSTAFSNLGIAYYDAKKYDAAEECHKSALALNPRLSRSLNNMGSIYKIYGKTEQAITFYQSAIKSSPHFAEPLNNLGTLFLERQEFRQAFDWLNQAIMLAPTFAEAHCNMGLVLLGLEQCDKALHYFEKALKLKPHYAEAYYGIAKIHLYQHDFVKAEYFIQKALATHSQHVEFYQLLVEIYREKGKYSEALIYLDQALSIDPTLSSLYISKGNILMEIGEISHAEEQFFKALEDAIPDIRILAHYCLIQLRKIKPEHQSFRELLSFANHIQDVSSNKFEYIYFALGKCYDDMNEPAKAFSYFKKGCDLKRNNITYNLTDDIGLTNKLIDAFTKETIAHLQTFANPSTLPIFIVGMPRSGTSLVEQIIASHPDVHGAGELIYFNDLIQRTFENHQLHYPQNILQLLQDDYQRITNNYLSYLRDFSSDAIRITDKMPQNFIAIGLIYSLFPNAKIIHIKRNPIDTCFSCYTKLFSHGHHYSYDLTQLGQYYLCYERLINHWRHILPAEAFLDISYEDMIHNLETEAKRLISYCDLSWDPACVAFYESKRQVRTASFMQVRQPVYTSSINRWRPFENELAPLIKILANTK